MGTIIINPLKSAWKLRNQYNEWVQCLMRPSIESVRRCVQDRIVKTSTAKHMMSQNFLFFNKSQRLYEMMKAK
jgi:hypothetical protein